MPANAAAASQRRTAITWSGLGPRARLWRVGHATWAVLQLGALGRIWQCVLSGHRDGPLWACVAFLGLQGAGLVAGRGNCPMGQRQEAWGDPVPLFELILPPCAAKAAVPVLAGVGIVAIAALAVSKPGLVLRAP